MTVTRFAPSPTGRLHRGHAFAALFAADAARRAGGRFLLRIEDIDASRCRPEFEAGIFEDFAWLGLTWEMPVRRQSEHMADYAAALARLDADGLLYRCFCTRAEIAREIAAAGGAPHGAEPVYPGTCRHLPRDVGDARVAAGAGYALRLDVAAAFARTGELVWHDRDAGTQRIGPGRFGDVVLARKDVPASYHLAATLDDHLQGVTLVTRGHDLFAATHVHRLLQALLGLATPEYRHHPLLQDQDGNRLAKRAGAASLAALRAAGADPKTLVRELGFVDFI
jgi:glutamyl-Q tRNA(Asp) synthetase